MFIVDDVILRSLGVSIPPFDLIWIFEQIRGFAYKEMYDPERIKDRIKENRMLYEFGEISKKEYKRIHADLSHKLKIALKVREMRPEVRIDILGLNQG